MHSQFSKHDLESELLLGEVGSFPHSVAQSLSCF